ncbi:hypothetical protein ID852_03700 [Xenorhabdus sp. 42]|uniref:hypothetical protein n=1 Tax=Xenorhabdus szentirmaii TaxID=290112 RepID=UPI00199718F9|nr:MULTISPECIES: hypothetical protein [unclassified Xenorhabdus]MBD2779283.1 hypothetical protein [Xenorhabdus sp. 38]MBD2819807.1 hypothetical protein [Xenorhabdus sp. 42]MBD2824000.1 hypothetical protein [Xenorhabdus sp. 5]
MRHKPNDIESKQRISEVINEITAKRSSSGNIPTCKEKKSISVSERSVNPPRSPDTLNAMFERAFKSAQKDFNK